MEPRQKWIEAKREALRKLEIQAKGIRGEIEHLEPNGDFVVALRLTVRCVENLTQVSKVRASTPIPHEKSAKD